jgi:hypothetical protein
MMTKKKKKIARARLLGCRLTEGQGQGHGRRQDKNGKEKRAN